ncbi:MAG: hypothetical protein LBT12_04920 [Oscillospiraceae bacterium]|jgi:hypothetical protein|nr:hypothetical protein [Oscillospiraceae bacterium]
MTAYAARGRKLTHALGHLREYGWLHIAGVNPEYNGRYASGVSRDSELAEFIRFDRHFASPLCVTSAVAEIERSGDVFRVLLRRGETLTVTAHPEQKFTRAEAACAPRDIFLHTLANPAFFSPARVSRRGNEALFTVDFGLAGSLTARQYERIRSLMEVSLGGRGEHMQFCRTVYFAADTVKGSVRAGLYNFETERPANTFTVHAPGVRTPPAERDAYAALTEYARGLA